MNNEKYRILNNPNTELKELAESQLQDSKNKYGKRYCPCALELNQDWICPCKVFRERDSEGECHCGRYIKVLKDEDR